MLLTWYIQAVKDPEKEDKGIAVTIQTPGAMMKDILTPMAARQLAAALLIEAEKAGPMPVAVEATA